MSLSNAISNPNGGAPLTVTSTCTVSTTDYLDACDTTMSLQAMKLYNISASSDSDNYYCYTSQLPGDVSYDSNNNYSVSTNVYVYKYNIANIVCTFSHASTSSLAHSFTLTATCNSTSQEYIVSTKKGEAPISSYTFTFRFRKDVKPTSFTVSTDGTTTVTILGTLTWISGDSTYGGYEATEYVTINCN
jgi:hypothetical protein